MSYGLIYTSSFDAFNSQVNTVEFYKKDYAGSSSAIVCGGGAVNLSWGPDEQKAPIKGLQLQGELVNIEGSFPLSNFYSVEDDTFLVKFYVGAALKFTGYLVQDDCNEIQVDFTHTLQFSATDNLGLLKDIALDQSTKAFTLVSTEIGVPFTFVAPNIMTAFASFLELIQVGDRLVITGTAVNGTYNIIGWQTGLPLLAESVATGGTYTGTIAIYRSQINGRYSLANIIKLALAPTTLELETFIFSRIKPVGGSTSRLLEDTFLDVGTFFNNETYDDCWKVLEYIMMRFRFTLLQESGRWVIISWNEVRENTGILYGYKYSADLVYIANVSEDTNTTIGNGSDIETGLTASILRPFKFVKDTFMYNGQNDLLKNPSFDILGPLLRTYPDGTNTVSEYGMPYWQAGRDFTSGGAGYITSSANRFIRVVQDDTFRETERYGVIEGNPVFSQPSAGESTGIEMSAGDIMDFSFEFKTANSQPGMRYCIFQVSLITTTTIIPRPATHRYLNGQGEWRPYGSYAGTTPGIPGATPLWLLFFQIPVGEDSNTWHQVNVRSQPCPFNGILYIKLAQAANGTPTPRETHYRKFTFSLITDSTGLIGQSHQQTQTPVIRNTQDEDIDIDDSPNRAISGSLFLESFTTVLQNLTTVWNTAASATDLRLGQIITRYEIFQRRKDRVKLEGTILRSNLSPLSLINYIPMSGLNFNFGMLDINFKTGQSKCTMWELYNDSEVDADLIEDYAFKFIYNTK